MRTRTQTIGSLGRAPARQPSDNNGPQSPKEPPPDDDSKAGGYLRRWVRGALFENTGLKFLSLVLAVTVFLLVNADKDREVTTRIGVKYEYPPDKVLVSEQLEEVKVTLKGPMRRLRQTSELALMELDLRLRDGQTGDVPITEDMIRNIPPGVEVVSISPALIRVVFDKKVEKALEVTPAVAGRPQHGYVVTEVKATPATIKVRGGERLLAAMSSIKTTEVSLEGRTEPFEQLAEVAVPEGAFTDPTQRITVQVRISEELVTKKVPSLVVNVKGDGIDAAKWQVSPPQVEVTLTGAVLQVEKAKEQMRPIVKLSASDTKAKDVDVVLDGLPPGVGVRISPERVHVTPIKLAP